ncbi:microtubule-binding protein [Grosmannia clavigera kw1407]|uniref:Microtubule-binding protein n=1 Tax=Grosmannia clavigera (strain kw1407 / UAMH 11150) TaxID=655863 RepID=F0XV13_GROCL|nr:microtubule-binding protein [Grosmannia clavigera kw1407]EFW98937.1 microtubule-binding protein [Grosmannia clavigera kw1407]
MHQQQQPIGRAGQAALLTWVNTFALDRKVERLEELADGQVFAQMLHDLDSEYDPAELEQNTGSSAWLTNKRNIQSVFKALTRYIIHKDRSGAIEFLPRTVDFRAISDNLNAEGLAQLVAVFVATAMLGSHNTQYIPVMRSSLTTAEQAAIMTILQRKAEERQRLADSGTDGGSLDEAETAMLGTGSSTGAGTDAALVAEERLATLAADYDRLSKRLADTSTRLEHLQMSYEAIKEELERKEKELDMERQSHGATESQLVRELQEKLREQDELISSQEAQAEEDRATKQRLAQESAQLKRQAALVEPLQDQVQELRHANDELSKKANTVDRYKQKLETQRGLETDLQNALYELGQNKEALKELEALQRRGGQQQATIERFREMVSGLEQQIEDNRLQRAALESDVYGAHVQLESLRDQSQLSEARIAELEQQLLVHGIVLVGSGSGAANERENGAGAGGGAPGSVAGSAGGNIEAAGGSSVAAKTFSLEDELQHEHEQQQQEQKQQQTVEPTAQALELARLRAENSLLRGRLESGTEGDHRLRNELEATRAKEESARQQYSALLEKHTVAEAQVQALLGGRAGEGSAVLAEARQRLQAAEGEHEQQTAAAVALERQVADSQRELLRLRGDLAAVEKGSVAEALAELQATDRLVSESLSQEVASLRREVRGLQLDKEQQQQLLVEALLSKGGMAKREAEMAAESDSTAEAEAKNGTTAGQPDKAHTTADSAATEEQLRRVGEKNEKLRAAVKQLKKSLARPQSLARMGRPTDRRGPSLGPPAVLAVRGRSTGGGNSNSHSNSTNLVIFSSTSARGRVDRADRRRAARLRFRVGVIQGLRADIRADIQAGIVAGFRAVVTTRQSPVSTAVATALLVAAAAALFAIVTPFACALLFVCLGLSAALFSPLLCAAAYYRYTLLGRRGPLVSHERDPLLRGHMTSVT